MLTLTHEEIYIYIDKVEELLQTVSDPTQLNLSNDSTGSVVDPGVIEITAVSGSYTSMNIFGDHNNIAINQHLSTGQTMVLDLRNRHYTIDGVPFLLDDYLVFKDNFNHNFLISLTGTGTAEAKYYRNQNVINNNDLFFCTGLDVNQNTEIIRSNNIKGKTKLRKTAKKDYQWSINGLCNDQELDKFQSGTGFFRIRLIDEDGLELEKLSNCVIGSFQKGSSDSSDYTYTLNGSFENIF